jgi:hypothetical protein
MNRLYSYTMQRGCICNGMVVSMDTSGMEALLHNTRPPELQ